jgi:hypothetical protein
MGEEKGEILFVAWFRINDSPARERIESLIKFDRHPTLMGKD